MNQKKSYSIYLFAATLAFLTTQTAATAMDPRDMGKMLIESPVKNILRKSSSSKDKDFKPDFSKLRIEQPTKRLLSKSSTTKLKPKIKSKVKAHTKNKKDYVQPGLVSWHQSLDAARHASKKSGKPLLVFHMMGRLDDRFC